MEVYNKLTELTNAIKGSSEYQRYSRAAQKIKGNSTYEAMIRDFLSAQIELSAMKMIGREPDEEKIDNFNTLYMTISSVADVSEFIQAQMAFSVMMDDVTKQIAAVTDMGYDFLQFDPSDFNY